jgi:hypothetical protein
MLGSQCYLVKKGREIAQQSASRVRGINHALLNEFSGVKQEVIARFLLHVAQYADDIVSA